MAHSSQPSKSNTSDLEQAVEWHILISSGEATSSEQEAFNLWFSEPNNARAYAKLEAVWNQFEGVSGSTERYALNQSLRKRNPLATSALLLAGVCVTGWLSLQTTPGQMLTADHIAVTAPRTLTLEDQSTLNLAPKTAVNIDYSQTHRRIELLSGSLQIDVAKDHTRPLTVYTNNGSAEALGTIFSVETLAEQMQVKVTESKVRVCSPAPTPDLSSCMIAQAGDQINVRSGIASSASDQHGRLDINWQKQLLIVEERPLLEVLDILQRYHVGYLQIDREQFINMKVSGVFPLKDLSQSLDIMATSLSLNIAQYPLGYTRIER